MLLQKNECVICESRGDMMALAELLENNGYRMFESHFGTITACAKEPVNGEYHQGWRWIANHEFPNCIAGISKGMCAEVRMTGIITDSEGRNRAVLIPFPDLMQRCCSANVEDLL